MSVKMLMIILLWIAGMIVDTLWCFSDKEEMAEIYDGISELVDMELSKGLVIGLIVIVAIISSATWPSDLVLYPYKQWKKSS